MKRHYLYHQAKSNYAYSVSETSIHIRFKSVKNKVKSVKLIWGDPFQWDIDPDTKEYVWLSSTSEETTLIKENSSKTFDYWFTEISNPTKRTKYAFLINNEYIFGSRDLYNLTDFPEEKFNLFNYFNFPYIHEVDRFKAPDYVKDTIWYSIFPDRFFNHENNNKDILDWESVKEYKNNYFFGGNLKGITKKLEYLKSFGVSGLYLNPIFLSPTAHKYDTIDYFEIDPLFGTKDDFKELVQKAHSLDIKVMLDAVFNHSSHLHAFFQDVVKNGEKSKYKDCFYIKDYPVINYELDENKMPVRSHELKSNLNYEAFAFSKNMPKLNVEHPLMREHLLKASRYWIEEFDIDGWRLDVSNEVSHDFWREFRKEVKAVKEDIFILGENWDNSTPWLQGDQMDAVMNYEFMYPIWSYFGTNIKSTKYTTERFIEKITETLFNYPKNVIVNMFNIIDSHDTARIMHICDGDIDLVKLVYLFQYSLPGSPSIYYGGEIGLNGDHDPDNRRCMIWDEDRQKKELFKFIKELSSLYEKYPCFKSADFRFLDYTDNTLIYQKDELIFLLNKGSKSETIDLKHTYKNIFTDEVYSEKLKLKKKSFKILKKAE